MDTNQQHIDPSQSDKVIWLAKEIFTAFPGDVTGLKVYRLGCGCIFYQRAFRDDDLDPQIGIYRDADDGPCDECSRFPREWKERVIDETVVYNSKFQIEGI